MSSLLITYSERSPSNNIFNSKILAFCPGSSKITQNHYFSQEVLKNILSKFMTFDNEVHGKKFLIQSLQIFERNLKIIF